MYECVFINSSVNSTFCYLGYNAELDIGGNERK